MLPYKGSFGRAAASTNFHVAWTTINVDQRLDDTSRPSLHFLKNATEIQTDKPHEQQIGSTQNHDNGNG
jgi:hypothetical protein